MKISKIYFDDFNKKYCRLRNFICDREDTIRKIDVGIISFKNIFIY